MRDGIRNNEPWMDEICKSRLLGIDFDITIRHVFGHTTNRKNDDGSNDDIMKDGTSEGGGLVARQIMDANNFVSPSLPPHQFFYGYPPQSLFSIGGRIE